jgi:hypothetical protein
MKKLLAGLLFTVLEVAAASPCLADQSAASESTDLEEIVVTASKTGAQLLQQTPLAISAFSGSQIQDEQISNVKDLVQYTPNLDGPDGVVASLAKATAFSVFLMTAILTLVWRAQAKAGKGTAASVGSRVLSWSRFVPRNVIGRALLFVLAAMVTLLPLGVAVCDWFDLYPMTKQGFALVNVCYGTLVGTVVTPFITLVAIAEQQAAGGKTGK